MTDASGAVIEERVFEPYGTPLWVDADYELERLGWNGKAVDPSTGWSDHGARWHATRFARWLSVDPPLKGPGGLVEHGLMATPYGFVAGNPVMFWDPDGKTPDEKNAGHKVWLICGGGQFCNKEQEARFHQLIAEERARDLEMFGPMILVDIVLFPFGGPFLSRGIGLLARGASAASRAAKAAKLVDAAEDVARVVRGKLAPHPSRASVPTGTRLPKDPGKLLERGYIETTHPDAAKAGRRTFEHPETGDKVHFDKGKPGRPGHAGKDHYHRDNPRHRQG